MIPARRTGKIADRQLPLGVGALTAAGALLGHEIGYLTDRATLGHGYLQIAAPIALIAMVALIWRLAINIVRQTDERLPSIGALASTQAALYLAFEIGERLVGETGSSLWSLPVLTGLAAQPLVAWLALCLLRVSRDVLVSIISRTAQLAHLPTVQLATVPATQRATPTRRTAAARGPPPAF